MGETIKQQSNVMLYLTLEIDKQSAQQMFDALYNIKL